MLSEQPTISATSFSRIFRCRLADRSLLPSAANSSGVSLLLLGFLPADLDVFRICLISPPISIPPRPSLRRPDLQPVIVAAGFSRAFRPTGRAFEESAL